MAIANRNWWSIGPLKGQNSSDNSLTLGEGWASETRNVTLEPELAAAVKRGGSRLLAGVPAMTYLIAYHLPINTVEENAEIWAFCRPSGLHQIHRKVGAGPFIRVATDTVFPGEVLRTVSFNGKLFMVGLTAFSNRIYVWDGTVIRPVGLAQNQLAGPTVTNTGAGTYAAVLRYYKTDQINFTDKTQARSELSGPTAFTPSGTGLAARVAKPTTLEHATHWRVWGSEDGNLYKRLSGNLTNATTFFDDTVAPALYPLNEFAPPVGLYLPPPSVTRIITDGHRLILGGKGSADSITTAGLGETTPSSNRVWFTPVLGALDQGDDERIPMTSDQRNFLDVGDPPMGNIIELAGPMDGQIFVFGRHRPWRLIPTGDLQTPYLTYPLTSAYGAGESMTYPQQAADIGETESGQPAVYFFDATGGVYRMGSGAGVQHVSSDLDQEFQSLRESGRLSSGMLLWSYPTRNQVWWVVPLNTPAELRIYVFHWRQGSTEGTTVRGGWTTWVHAEAEEMSRIIMHNRTPGGGSNYDKEWMPYAIWTNTDKVYVFDRPREAKDGLTAYRGYVAAAPVAPSGAELRIRVGNPVIAATAQHGATLRVTAVKDFGVETAYADLSLAPYQSETQILRTIEGLTIGDMTAFQITVGDALPSDRMWEVNLFNVPMGKQEPR